MLAWAMAAVATALPAHDGMSASTGTTNGQNEYVPPHLFAAASDGEAFLEVRLVRRRLPRGYGRRAVATGEGCLSLFFVCGLAVVACQVCV